MKKIILAALLLTGITAGSYAQERPERTKKTPEEKAQIMTDHMAKKLALSEQQKTEIYKINLDRAKDMEKTRAQASEDRKKAFSEQKKKFEASDEKINKILNSEQKKAYAELKSQRQEKMKSHKGGFHKRLKERKGDA